MPRQSAGLLMYRKKRRDESKCSSCIRAGPSGREKTRERGPSPRGSSRPRSPLDAAQREFHEETGFTACGDFRPLETIRQAGGKIVHAWAVEGDCDAEAAASNSFTMEYPPHSGRLRSFPEVDRAAWFPLAQAREKILKSQLPLLDQLETMLGRQASS